MLLLAVIQVTGFSRKQRNEDSYLSHSNLMSLAEACREAFVSLLPFSDIPAHKSLNPGFAPGLQGKANPPQHKSDPCSFQ